MVLTCKFKAVLQCITPTAEAAHTSYLLNSLPIEQANSMYSLLGIRKRLHAKKLATGDSHTLLSVCVFAVRGEGRNIYIYIYIIYIFYIYIYK